jgi:hypothetical protein
MPPRQPGLKIAGSAKFFEPEVLASSRLVLGIEPLCSPERVVLGRSQIEVVNFRPHRAIEAARLIDQGAPDDEDPPPQCQVGFDPQETIT